MSAAATTATQQLTTAFLKDRDYWSRALDLIEAVEQFREAFENCDEDNMLADFASELRANLFQQAQMVLDRHEEERESDRQPGFQLALRAWDESLRALHRQDNAIRKMNGRPPAVYEPVPGLLQEQCA
jgi:hypothetical protein